MNREAGESRPPTNAWERALHPASASRGVLALLLVAVGVFLTLAVWTGLQDAHRPTQDQTASQTSVPVASTPRTEPASGTTSTPASMPEPRTQQISRCTSRAGSASYSDAPCPAGTFASIVTVHPDTNLADGLGPETRRTSIGSNAAAVGNTAP
ncbi:MAG: hypothetical protein ACRYGA_03120 [Janthinobacterium lividum]